jgi:hypothetical protein
MTVRANRSARAVRRWIGLVAIALALVLIPAGSAYASVSIKWAREFGTTSNDGARAVTHDGTGVYVAGDKNTANGITNDWVYKFSPSGTLEWTISFGGKGWDPQAVAVGGGLVYVAGVDNSGSICANDAGFVAAISTAGSPEWFNESNLCHIAFYGVAADSSGAYVTGADSGALPGHVSNGGWDAVLVKIDPTGVIQWTSQFGTASKDVADAVTIGGGDVFMAGNTSGALPGKTLVGSSPNAFIRAFTLSGGQLWTREYADSNVGETTAAGLSMNDSGVAVVGQLLHQQAAGSAYVREFSPGGSALWTREFGTPGLDAVIGGVSGRQAIWVTDTNDSSTAGGSIFVRRFDLSGNLIDTSQFGTGGSYGLGIEAITATTTAGYLVGLTTGRWPGQTNAGGYDAYLLKLV